MAGAAAASSRFARARASVQRQRWWLDGLQNLPSIMEKEDEWTMASLWRDCLSFWMKMQRLERKSIYVFALLLLFPRFRCSHVWPSSSMWSWKINKPLMLSNHHLNENQDLAHSKNMCVCVRCAHLAQQQQTNNHEFSHDDASWYRHPWR